MKVPPPPFCFLPAYGHLGHSVQDVWLGYHKQRTSLLILPQVWNASYIGVVRLACGQPHKVVSWWPIPAQLRSAGMTDLPVSIVTTHRNPNQRIFFPKTIFSSRQRFPKPTQAYEILKFFGNNIVVTEFDEWKRYRKIAAPAFGEVRHHQWV